MTEHQCVCVCVFVCACVWLPVSMSCCQTVRVHVSLWCGGDAITVHGSHHGVCSPLQQQTHQFKVTCARKMIDTHTENEIKARQMFDHYSACQPHADSQVLLSAGYRKPAGVVSV